MRRISPTPVLFIVSLNDVINTTDLQLEAYDQALPPKQLILLKGDHFAPYLEEFSVAASGALTFFQEHLFSLN